MTRRKSKNDAQLPAEFKLLSVRSVGVGHVFRNAETLHGFQKEETDLTTCRIDRSWGIDRREIDHGESHGCIVPHGAAELDPSRIRNSGRFR